MEHYETSFFTKELDVPRIHLKKSKDHHGWPYTIFINNSADWNDKPSVVIHLGNESQVSSLLMSFQVAWKSIGGSNA